MLRQKLTFEDDPVGISEFLVILESTFGQILYIVHLMMVRTMNLVRTVRVNITRVDGGCSSVVVSNIQSDGPETGIQNRLRPLAV